jgi:hypothetical protein
MPMQGRRSGKMARLCAFATVSGALWLGACGSGARPLGQLEIDPVWLAEIKAHYRAYAYEQRGACKAPVLDRVLDGRVEARSDQRVVLRVRYAYSQLGDEPQSGACRGTGERVFRLERRGAGWRAVAMTGPGRLSPGGLFRIPFG